MSFTEGCSVKKIRCRRLRQPWDTIRRLRIEPLITKERAPAHSGHWWGPSSTHKMQNEKNDRDYKQDPGNLRGNAGNSGQTESRSDQSHDEKH
jgi:hypothetical protein